MPDLTNKVVLITGASSGFGAEAARHFAAAGCKVVLAARRMDRLQDLAASIQNMGGEAMAIPVDILDTADIDNMVQSALDLYGRIDILFNNAGIGRVDWFERFSPDRDIETLINVNLVGLVKVTRAVLPHMIRNRSGHIINMISVAGLVYTPLITTYAASKAGARAFTDALRREVRPFGINVSGVYPGPARTEFGEHIGKGAAYDTTRRILRHRMTSDYVARRVVDVARHPRRSLIIPWWFRLAAALEALFPVVVDWVAYYFTNKNHKPD